MTRPRTLNGTFAATLLALAGSVGAGCVGSGGDEPLSLLDDGDRLMEIGDFTRAVSAYRRDLGADPQNESLRAKVQTARARAASHYTDLALLAASGGDLSEAQRMLSRAQGMDPELPYVRNTVRELGAVLENATRASELAEQARVVMKINPIRAEEMLVEARTLHSSSPRIVKLLADATLRAEAERGYLRSKELWEEGRLAEAIVVLRRARYDGAPVKNARALWRRIEKELVTECADANEDRARQLWRLGQQADLSRAAVRTLRAALVDRLSERAAALRTSGMPAVAALVEIEARRVGGRVSTPALDAARRTTAIDLVVAPFAIDVESDVDSDLDGARIADVVRRRVAEDLDAGGLLLLVVDDDDETGKGIREARLTGRIDKVEVVETRPFRTRRTVTYQSGTRHTSPAETTEQMAELGELRKEIVAAVAEQKEARENLEILLASHEKRMNNLRFDAFSKRRLNQTVARARAADETVRALRERGEALLDVETGLPRRTEVAVYSEHEIEVTTRTKTAVVGGDVRVMQGDARILVKPLVASVRHEETSSDAFAPAGVAEDPDELPDDAALVATTLERFAELVSAEVRHAAEEFGRIFLEEARAAEAEGRVDAAAEGYAQYLLATPELVTDDRAEAARAVRELAQVNVVVRSGAGTAAR